MSNWTDDKARGGYGGGNPPDASEIQRQHQIETNKAEEIRQRMLEEQRRREGRS